MAEIAMTAPLFATYQLGLLFLEIRNGADLVTTLLLRLLDASVLAYIGFVLALSFGMWWFARGKPGEAKSAFVRTLLESTALAILLVLLVGWTGSHLASVLRISSDSVLGSLIVSAGAGFHEELVFRVILFAGGTELLIWMGRKRTSAAIVAAIVSSVLFSLAHHIGPLGDPLALFPLVARFVSGLYFAGVFSARGFATAAYTHAIYDVIVLVLLR